MEKSLEAFVAAVMQRLAEYAPAPDGAAVSALFAPSDPPETIGRIRERDDRHEHSYPQLQAAQKRRSKQKMSGWSRHMRAKKDNDNG